MLRFLLVLAITCPALAQDAPTTVDPTVRTSGTASFDAIRNEVAVTYDGFGVPTVVAKSRGDAYFAQGFLHAQNRYTQMDMTRRFAAGELCELVGASAYDQDAEMRSLRLRSIARACVEGFGETERRLLKQYVDGVNAGLADLQVPPPEYAILRVSPEAWEMEDTVLVMLAFSVMLDRTGAMEIRDAAMFESLPEEVRDYLYNPLSRFDAPIPGLEARKPSIPRIPDRQVISLRDLPEQPPVIEYRYDMGDDDDGPGGPGDEDDADDTKDPGAAPKGDSESDGERRLDSERTTPGSNNWGVSGRLTHDGRAILASDPHLQLALPGAWYRIRMEWPDQLLVGLSLPGTPGVIMGTNGHVAWGFTNLTGDLQDLITIETDPEDEGRYRTADGWEPFGEVVETIEIAGMEPRELRLKTTRWGVVNAAYQDARGETRMAVREWAALHPEHIDLNVLAIEESRTVEEGLDALATWTGPPQNAVVVDSAGAVGYTITGFLPNRGRKDGRGPYGLWDGTPSWTTRAQLERPRLEGEDVDYVFTANNRTLDQRIARKLGYAWGHPARARRIADVLATTNDTDERAMLELQRDTTTVALEPWKRLVLNAIPADETDEELLAAREALLAWNSRADTDQVGITLLDEIRTSCLEELSESVADWAGTQGLGLFDEAYIHEEPYLRVIEDEAPNWLPPGEAEDWQDWMRIHVRRAIENGGLRPWGDRNQITISSSFVDAAPAPMRSMLEIRTGPQPGYWNAPKVMAPGFGASAQLVVSPSHLEDAILLTPGGQSGNPLSPHFRNLNDSWIAGEPVPLLPGATVATFSLMPGSDAAAPAN